MTTFVKPAHHWEHCDHCEIEMVVCGTCGNNCCNAGYGEIMGPEPGTTIPCPDCPSAYALFKQGHLDASTENVG